MNIQDLISVLEAKGYKIEISENFDNDFELILQATSKRGIQYTFASNCAYNKDDVNQFFFVKMFSENTGKITKGFDKYYNSPIYPIIESYNSSNYEVYKVESNKRFDEFKSWQMITKEKYNKETIGIKEKNIATEKIKKMNTKNIVTPTLVKIQDVTKGDFFRLNIGGKQGKKTYTKDGYCRESKKYCGSDYEDFCSQVYKKKDTLVWVGFEF